jgi:15-hydroxyprostaglandin dehydrogenase (NAD)
VVLADIRPEAYTAIASSLDSSRHVFIHTDVASWDSQASLFRRAYDYGGGKIDFFAANAGTAEREHITLGNPLRPEDVDGEPTEPNMQCTQVNQIAVFYGLKLFVHYTRRTAKRLKSESESASATSNGNSNRSVFSPKMVITSSCSGLYPFPVAPEYCEFASCILLRRSWLIGLGISLRAKRCDEYEVNCT